MEIKIEQPRAQTQGSWNHSMKWVIAAAAALVLGLLAYQVLHSRTGGPSIKPPDLGRQTDSSIQSLLDLMRDSFDYEGFRAAVGQLNVYVENSASDKPPVVTTEERQVLLKQYLLDDDELAEVSHTTYTPLDAHYLDLRFLLRDAVRSLKVEQLQPVDRAAATFAWAMRQVRLRDSKADLLPPDFVLRRGWGNARERAIVFIALLEQLGLPACIVALPGQQGDRFWVGALIDKEIYLFDTRLGVALPGAKPKGIGTLAQVRADPKLLERVGAEHKPYAVQPNDLAGADLQVAGSLSALAPRMRYLQNLLASTEDIHLAMDPVGVFNQFQTARGLPGPVHVWNQQGSWNTPFRVARHFLPADEGGVDRDNRRAGALRALVPESYYPQYLLQMFPLGADPGDRLYRGLFALPFVAFHSQARLPRDLAQSWLPGLFEEKGDKDKKPGGPDREQKPKGAEILEHERMPRDLVLRGRYPEATALLVAIKDELQRQKGLLQRQKETEGLEEQIRLWCETARQEYAAYYRSKNASPAQRNAAESSAPEVTRNPQDLWQHAGPVIVLVQGRAAEPMYRDVVYLLALTKQEQAERALARLEQSRRTGKSPSATESRAPETAFKSAATWWEALVSDPGATEYHDSARLFLARCRTGDRGQSR
jgi:hypothetical protein